MAILKECIVKASEIGATSLALPAVGMGVKGYPSKMHLFVIPRLALSMMA